MDHTNDRCAVPPPLGGDSTATAYCLQKDHRIIYRSQCANLSFFHYLIAHSLYNGFRLKSRVKPGEMQLVAKMLLSRKWSGMEKEESKGPPKIDHPPTAATGEITKAPWVLKCNIPASMRPSVHKKAGQTSLAQCRPAKGFPFNVYIHCSPSQTSCQRSAPGSENCWPQADCPHNSRCADACAAKAEPALRAHAPACCRW